MCNKTIAFDLDDVICYRTSELGDVEKYNTCEPHSKMIDIVNNCHDNGYKIIIYTSRGMTGFNGNTNDIYSNLYELTIKQLDNWGVKYHQLIMGKAHFDVLIDDKCLNSERINSAQDIFKFLNKE